MYWLQAGAEEEPLPSNSYTLDFIERYGGLIMPEPNFSDPHPWTHFSSLPHLVESRNSFLGFCEDSLPRWGHSVKVMDIGCGDGSFISMIIHRLLESEQILGVGELLLLDPSPRMLETAFDRIRAEFSDVRINAVLGSLESRSAELPGGFDLAVCSLSVHHMPYELKTVHIGRLCSKVGHLLILEMEANHDTPDFLSPELGYSVFQWLGHSLSQIMESSTTPTVKMSCADLFIMTKAVSLLTEPRGQRTEYHMLREQWHELMADLPGSRSQCLGTRTCYHDDHCELFALHFIG